MKDQEEKIEEKEEAKEAEVSAELKPLDVPSVITVKEFSELVEQPVAEVIKVLLTNGFLATINETLDFETAALIASEFGFEAKEEKIDESKVDVITPEQLAEIVKQEKETGENLTPRAPIVTILGHVDHGKTTLLDTIRKAKVAESESGGITQHITAYQVKAKGRLITFVDTPGHEAFSKMRSRGAGVADIAILIVAADDGVKPQTKEVIENLKAGKVPMVVAINKIDKPEANPEMVKGQLAEAGILLEQRGGNIPYVEISAKNNLGIDELLDTVLLLADLEKIEADESRKALGLILESHLDQQKGPVATAITKTGTLREGDSLIAGKIVGTARQLLDYNGKRISEVKPGSPVTIVGLGEVTEAGTVISVAESRSVARERAKRGKLDITGELSKDKATVKKLEENKENESIPKLNLILKADTGGSLEAIDQILGAIPSDQVKLNMLLEKVGNVTETDAQLAATSKAIVYAFKVQVPDVAQQTAKKNGAAIKSFDVIYKLVEDVKEEMSSLLPPEIIRNDLGELEVLAIFRTEKDKMIVGGRVTKGKVVNGALMEIERDGEIIGKGKVSQLKHNQDETEEVKEGLECGITYAPEKGLVKIEEGDKLKFYIEEEQKREIK